MSSSGVDEKIEFTWSIKDCDFIWFESVQPESCCRRYGDSVHHVTTKELRSPLISAGSPPHTVWYLNLYAHTSSIGEHLLSYQLVRLHGSFDGHFNCKLLLASRNGRMERIPWLSGSGGGLIVEKHFLSQEALTLLCRLTFSGPPHQYTSGLTELKQNINSLFLSGEFSDLTLYTEDKEFFVHRFILQKRIPKLLEDLGLLEENREVERVKVANISSPVLQTLLQYVYCGEMYVLPEESLRELYPTVEKYQVEQYNAIHLEKSATITTELNVVRRIISFKTDVNKAFGDANILYEHINFEYALFLVKVSLIVYVQTALMLTRIVCLRSLDEDILMSCVVSSGSDKKDLKNDHTQMLQFSTLNSKKGHNLQHKLNYNSKDGGLHLQLNLAISNGRRFNSVDGMTPSPPQRLSVFGKGLLSCDMNSLGGETFFSEDHGDVSLCFDHGILKAHKAILSAWSPVFTSMFHDDMIEKNSGEVNIPDIEFQTGLRLLQFMYSGMISKACYEEDAKLYAAADKYLVSLLFGKCSSFLASHLTADNACDMLVLADQRSDDNLIDTAQKYITSNQKPT